MPSGSITCAVDYTVATPVDGLAFGCVVSSATDAYVYPFNNADPLRNGFEQFDQNYSRPAIPVDATADYATADFDYQFTLGSLVADNGSAHGQVTIYRIVGPNAFIVAQAGVTIALADLDGALHHVHVEGTHGLLAPFDSLRVEVVLTFGASRNVGPIPPVTPDCHWDVLNPTATLFWTSPTPACDLTVTPATAIITTLQTQQFTASGTSTPVNWSVVGGAGNGTISGAGLYTPPATPGTYSVLATSIADPSCFDGGTVTVGRPIFAGVRRKRTQDIMRPPYNRPKVLFNHKPFLTPPPCTTHWLLYLAGMGDGTDVSTAAFGAPTEFTFSSIPANIHQGQTQPVVDLGGVEAGRFMVIKLRREGGNALDTCTDAETALAVELFYDEQ